MSGASAALSPPNLAADTHTTTSSTTTSTTTNQKNNNRPGASNVRYGLFSGVVRQSGSSLMSINNVGISSPPWWPPCFSGCSEIPMISTVGKQMPTKQGRTREYGFDAKGCNRNSKVEGCFDFSGIFASDNVTVVLGSQLWRRAESFVFRSIVSREEMGGTNVGGKGLR